MTRLKLYALVLTAERVGNGCHHRQVVGPAVCIAQCPEGAVAEGVNISRQTYPVEDGWFGHNAWAVEVQAELIEVIHSQKITNE